MRYRWEEAVTRQIKAENVPELVKDSSPQVERAVCFQGQEKKETDSWEHPNNISDLLSIKRKIL